MPREGSRPVAFCVRTAIVLALVSSAALLAPRPACAIPAFARKYQTSCQTCHVAMPALTPFGEAFRLNGYRFPAGNDPAMTKDSPVSLGAEGYKKLWPQSVWPGEMPGMPPLAVLYTSTIDYDHAGDLVTFGGMGGELEILGSGTMDEHFSFWGSVVFARDETGAIGTEMERVNLQVRPLDSPALQFKVGSFEPGIMLVSTHRSLMDQELWALTQPAGDNPWAPEAFQQGFEAYGMLQHRVLYNAGLVEGSGSLGDKSKDVYARLAYKLGGLPFDGVPSGGAEATMPANPKPWSETSVALSGFVYKGKGLLAGGDPADPNSEDPFRVVGGDVAVNYRDLMAHAGYTDRKDDRPLLADPATTDVKIKSTFAELSWVAYPWLIPAARWESTEVVSDKAEQASLTVNGLVRANVKTFLAANWVKEPEGKYTNEGATLGVIIGF
ncbi:MAG: hypothetical protein U0167_03035 [bacterium]